ncbi:hypothetical protein ANO11243_045520 [Dothideomycetidae sp. 11243]|nr:hypothetical protein ANO11243_045520 [fungal sp. No.11243]
MPKDNLHMTALEITHSLTAAEISTFVDQLAPVARSVIDFPFSHRARLIKPRLELDAQALALSFLPASGGEGDEYTYHHLRRDLYSLCTEAGVKVASRYVVPSAHLTIARFVFDEDFGRGEGFDHGLMQRLVALVEEINGSLEREYWPSLDGEEVKSGGQWIVGEGKGLDHRRGTLWYGGGETIVLGKGF